MTPEQNEQWRAAILPMAESLTLERWEAEKVLIALMPRVERLERISLLCGSRKLSELGLSQDLVRHALLDWRAYLFTKPWFPRFALRSACALFGIQMAHPEGYALRAPFNRVKLSFVRESFLPFIEWLRQMPPGEARKDNYMSLIALYEACEDSSSLVAPEKWHEVISILSKCKEPGTESEKGQCLEMVNFLLNSILYSLNLDHMRVQSDYTLKPIGYEVNFLNRQYQWRFLGYSRAEFFDAGDYTELIAAA